MANVLAMFIAVAIGHGVKANPLGVQAAEMDSVAVSRRKLVRVEYDSVFPSIYPSSLPNVLPSALPSVFPTKSQTDLPSISPSNLPSIAPTTIQDDPPPSGTQSTLPSISPSTSLSDSPSYTPSSSPSISAAPSTTTKFPSPSPSNFPTQLLRVGVGVDTIFRSSKEIVVPEEKQACLNYTALLADAFKGVLFSEDDSREYQTTVNVTAFNGVVPCVNSSSVRRLSVQVSETVTSYEMVISYGIYTIISFSGEEDLTTKEEQLMNDIVEALPLEKVRAAFQTPEIKAVIGDATMGKISVEDITGGDNIFETGSPTSSKPPSASPSSSPSVSPTKLPITGKSNKGSKGTKESKESKKSKKSKKVKTTKASKKDQKSKQGKDATLAKTANILIAEDVIPFDESI